MKKSIVPFIDSHFHLIHLLQQGLDPENLIDKCLAAGVCRGMDIAVDLKDIERRRKICEQHSGFGYTIGLYPSLATLENIEPSITQFRQELEKRAKDHLLWAIGEIGLDFHWNYENSKNQHDLLKQQVELAMEYSLPVVIHNRKADYELLRLLNDVEGIMHCFSSESNIMKAFLDKGFYISFAGNLTFKNAAVIQDAARLVPLDRVLFETDSPYLSPSPMRGKINTPVNVMHTYRFFANLRGIDIEELKAQASSNFTRAIPRSGKWLK